MVKYLFNYPVIDWYEKELQLMGQSLGEYVASMKLDGIEQLIYDNNMILKYKESTIGVHLEYWSYWIDFWWNNQQRLDYIFESNEEKKHYYKAQNIYEWIEYIKKYNFGSEFKTSIFSMACVRSKCSRNIYL